MRRSARIGFTVIELLVVIAIIGILMAILLATFNDARQSARDEARQASLKELQLAIELYKAQNGTYPEAGCGVGHNPGTWTGPGPLSSWGQTCPEYIAGLVPDYISELPTDPSEENTQDLGFKYRTDGNSYKVVVHLSVESKFIDSYDDEFARCPRGYSGVSFCPVGGTPQSNSYAVYSLGAENW
jgi:prepilin-type N-terminal cleavage/methylation domain-containing protein